MQQFLDAPVAHSSRAHKFRIYHGAGEVFEVPSDKLQGTGGSCLDALRAIASEHIRDPDLMRTLNDNGLVLQEFSSEGDVHQRTMSPREEFSPYATRLTQQDVEVSASVRHTGGTRQKGV